MSSDMLFDYKGVTYPAYLKNGNACQYIAPVALQFCRGKGLDVGCSDWPLPGAIPVDEKRDDGFDAYNLPDGKYDYVFSSHCLEHLDDPVKAVEHWKTRLRQSGVLFLYLPHPDQRYWQPANCRKHKHVFHPEDVAQMLEDLGFRSILTSERDLVWSFCCVAFNPDK